MLHWGNTKIQRTTIQEVNSNPPTHPSHCVHLSFHLVWFRAVLSSKNSWQLERGSPNSDHMLDSPYYMNRQSSRQVMRIKITIMSWCTTNIAMSKENWYFEFRTQISKNNQKFSFSPSDASKILKRIREFARHIWCNGLSYFNVSNTLLIVRMKVKRVKPLERSYSQGYPLCVVPRSFTDNVPTRARCVGVFLEYESACWVALAVHLIKICITLG